MHGQPLYHNLWIGMCCQAYAVRKKSNRSRHRSHRASRNMDCKHLNTSHTTPILTRQKLAAIIWGAIFSNKLIFFSAHPVSPSPLKPRPPPTNRPTTQLLNSVSHNTTLITPSRQPYH